MRLLEELPILPEGEGDLSEHSTGQEHVTKFAGAERWLNLMREAYLRRNDGQSVEGIESKQWYDMLLENNHEVVLVYRQDLPSESEGARGLVGAGIAERSQTGDFAKTIKTTELVVHPDLRGKGVASYILNRLTEHDFDIKPTELVVDTSVFQAEDRFVEALASAGFRHTDKDGSPALWLPGTDVHPPGDIDDPEVVRKILDPMPDDWNGVLNLFPKTDSQAQIWRGGKRLGKVRPVPGSRCDDDGIPVYDFSLHDRGDAELDRVHGLTKRDAIIALLNNYDLIKS